MVRLIKHRFKLQLNEQTLNIAIKEGLMTDLIRRQLINHFADFIINTFEEKWLLKIISGTFYYEEEDAQTEILNIVKSIFDGEKQDLPKLESLPSKRALIIEAISDLMDDHSTFCFDSILTFRLNNYRTCLLNYVELAIDEYKLQQDYLMFVDKMRRIVRAYRPLHKKIYVIDKKPFVLYDEKLNEITNFQSIRSFYPLLKQWGIEADPSITLTLIGLAPEQVHIYTDRPDEGMMMTIQSVFEERVSFHPLTLSQSLKN